MPRKRERGFTLIEVLVALVVTSLVLGIVMNAALQAKTRAVATRDKQAALLLGRSLVAGRSIAPFDRAARSGDSGGLRWSVTERAVAADRQDAFVLAQIDVSVRDGRGVALSALSLRKIKAMPPS